MAKRESSPEALGVREPERERVLFSRRGAVEGLEAKKAVEAARVMGCAGREAMVRECVLELRTVLLLYAR